MTKKSQTEVQMIDGMRLSTYPKQEEESCQDMTEQDLKEKDLEQDEG